MPERAAAAQALAAWREAVKRLEATDSHDPDWSAAVAAEEDARVAYHDAFRLAVQRHPEWDPDDRP